MRRPKFTERLEFNVSAKLKERVQSVEAYGDDGRILSRAELCRRLIEHGISQLEQQQGLRA